MTKETIQNPVKLVDDNAKRPPGGIGRRARLKSEFLHGSASSILAEATTYKLVIYNPADERTTDTLKGFASGWMWLRHKDKLELAERLNEDRLLVSDLFYLKRLLRDLFVMKQYRFGFKRA